MVNYNRDTVLVVEDHQGVYALTGYALELQNRHFPNQPVLMHAVVSGKGHPSDVAHSVDTLIIRHLGIIPDNHATLDAVIPLLKENGVTVMPIRAGSPLIHP